MRLVSLAALIAVLALLGGQPQASAQTRVRAVEVLNFPEPLPSEIVQLLAIVPPVETVFPTVINPDGSKGSTFTIPPGKVFILTDVIAWTSHQQEFLIAVCNGGCWSRVNLYLDTSRDSLTKHISLQKGVVFSTHPLKVVGGGINRDEVLVTLYGYLADDR